MIIIIIVIILYSRKLSREKTFADWYNYRKGALEKTFMEC